MARVVFVTTSYPRAPGDPAGHFVATEAERRAASGDRVTVLAPRPTTSSWSDGTPNRRDALLEDGMRPAPRVIWLPGGDAFGAPGAIERLTERPTRLADAATFVVAARRTLARLRADEIVAHWLLPSAWPIAYLHDARLEVVLHGSDVRLVERLPRSFRLHVLRSLVARGATFRFVSHELRDRLSRATDPALLSRSRVAPCALDLGHAPARIDARARLGLPERASVAVIVGRLVRSKRPGESIALARTTRPDLVTVIGDGPLRGSLERQNPDVRFTGALDRQQTLTWIAAADLLVSASREEGAPTVVREARALGTRVLAVPSGDLRLWAAKDAGISLAAR